MGRDRNLLVVGVERIAHEAIAPLREQFPGALFHSVGFTYKDSAQPDISLGCYEQHFLSPELCLRQVRSNDPLLTDAIRNTDFLIVVASLDEIASCVTTSHLSELAEHEGCPAIFIVALPFDFLGPQPRRFAQEVRHRLARQRCTFLPISCETLCDAPLPDPNRGWKAEFELRIPRAYEQLTLALQYAFVSAMELHHSLNSAKEKSGWANKHIDLGFGIADSVEQASGALSQFRRCPLLLPDFSYSRIHLVAASGTEPPAHILDEIKRELEDHEKASVSLSARIVPSLDQRLLLVGLAVE